MINYELAKELKGAGFPQKDGGAYWTKNMAGRIFLVDSYDEVFTQEDHDIKQPTLSELIEAVGMVVLFYSPGDNTRDKGWYAAEGWLEVDGYYKPSEGGRKTKHGESPEIAVAKLWLSLHEKN